VRVSAAQGPRLQPLTLDSLSHVHALCAPDVRRGRAAAATAATAAAAAAAATAAAAAAASAVAALLLVSPCAAQAPVQAGQAADALLRGPSVPPNSSNVLAGTFAWERGDLAEPVACAATGDGRFVVVDSCGYVRAMSASDGQALWTTDRGAGGAFVRPASVASFGDGAVLVSDPARRTVALLSIHDGSDLGEWPAEGELRRAWSASGIVPGAIASGPGPADVPRVVVADADAPGRIMIADGEVVRTLALPFVPSGLALAHDGSIMVSDRDGHGVTRIGPELPRDLAAAPESLTWGGRGPYPGLLNSPRGICAAGPWVLVADEHNHRIVRADVHGAGKLAYGQHAVRPRTGGGKVHYPIAVAYDSETGLALICEPFERRVQAYRASLDPEPAEVRVVLPSLEGVQSHFGPGADADGLRLVMQDPESSSAVVFDLSLDAPVHVSTLGMAGSKPHEHARITSIAVAGEAALVCVADDGARRLSLWSVGPREEVLRFNPFAGRLVSVRTYESLGMATHEHCADVVSRAGGWAVLVGAGSRGTDAARALTLDHLLSSVSPMPLAAPGQGRWRPIAMAWSDGDASPTWMAGRVDAPAGAPMRWVLVRDGASVELDAQDPVDLCVTRDRRVLVVDRLGDRVIEMRPPSEPGERASVSGKTREPADAAEVEPRTWGGRGAADGMMWLPVGIVAHGDTVYVVDGGNHRGQAFSSRGVWRSTFGLGRSYTRPRSEEEVLGMPGARGAPLATAGGTPEPPVPGAATSRTLPESVRSRLWWAMPTAGDAVQGPVRSNGGRFWIRARIESESAMPDASTPPLRRPFAVTVEAFEDSECTRPYIADAATVDSWMPHHRHGMNVAPRISASGPGQWRAEGMLMHMSGMWEIDIDLVKDGRSERAQWMVDLP
jgi:hypothetical protein